MFEKEGRRRGQKRVEGRRAKQHGRHANQASLIFPDWDAWLPCRRSRKGTCPRVVVEKSDCRNNEINTNLQVREDREHSSTIHMALCENSREHSHTSHELILSTPSFGIYHALLYERTLAYLPSPLEEYGQIYMALVQRARFHAPTIRKQQNNLTSCLMN